MSLQKLQKRCQEFIHTPVFFYIYISLHWAISRSCILVQLTI